VAMAICMKATIKMEELQYFIVTGCYRYDRSRLASDREKDDSTSGNHRSRVYRTGTIENLI
jgi:hypothetical protein